MDREQKTKLLAIVGPTASGKSGLALALAERYGGEILSCDSMQIYREMDIGTAKPTAEERLRVPHHLFDFVDPRTPFSCADYVSAAIPVIVDVTARRRLPILCGGTGLYLDRLLSGASFEETDGDPAYREELRSFAEREGAAALHARLRAVDPEAAEAVHENNVRRVVRALEIYHTTGKTKSEWDRLSREKTSPYDAVTIGLRFLDRENLYARIDARVDAMIRAGLADEARRLDEAGVFRVNATAAQAIGYKELFGYLRGEATLGEAADALKQATRKYAKRQMTWFLSHGDVRWIDADGKTFRQIEDEACRIWEGN